MAKVTFSGKQPTKPLFGASRGGLMTIRQKLGLSSGTSSQPKKELSKEGKEMMESYNLHRKEEADRALSGEQA